MPLYDFRCRECDEVFELRRSMAEADVPATCPAGHTSTVRLLPMFASTGRATAGSSASLPSGPPAGGCGAGCGCAH